MLLAGSLIVLSSLSATLTSANCHKTGPKPDRVLARDNVDIAAEYMMGYFAGHQTKQVCISDVKSGNSWVMQVVRDADSPFTYGFTELRDNLKRQIYNPDNQRWCDHGGEAHEMDGTLFNIRAKPGTCLDMNYINEHPLSGHKEKIRPMGARPRT